MNTIRKQAIEPITQYELTTEIVTKLNTYDITPTAKLVLLYLTTCYNPKHADVFPKQKTIALKLGISERSVTRAIQELHREGLVLIECKYTNRYKFTSKIVNKCPVKMADDIRQNNSQNGDNLSLHKQTIKHDKEQTLSKGGNVYSEDDNILRDYAIKHGAKNIDAYINALKKTKSAENIIKEKNKIAVRAVAAISETKKQIQIYEDYRNTRESYENIEIWENVGKKFGIKK